MSTRTKLACNHCRELKLRCINEGNDRLPCQRCQRLQNQCTYTPTASQLRKKTRVLPIPSKTEKRRNQVPSLVLPEKPLWGKIAETFFHNQYQGIFPFVHGPSFKEFLESPDFSPATYLAEYSQRADDETMLKWPDPLVLLGILALCARLVPTLTVQYGAFDENKSPESFVPGIKLNKSRSASSCASKYFAWHARSLLKDVFDRPSVQRVQALTMLSSHEWGEKNVARSFLYVGIAARMSLVLGLGEINSLSYKHEAGDVKTTFLVNEMKRRTLWSVYMMDRCISSGRNRSSSIRIDDINVALPCTEQAWVAGLPVNCMTYQELQRCVDNDGEIPGPENLTACCFTILAFEIWAKIAKWAGEGGARAESKDPWTEDSTYFQLSRDLNNLEANLPSSLKYDPANLVTQISEHSAGSFGYLHSILFLSRVFLNREYFFLSPELLAKGWWAGSTRKLLDAIRKSSSLINTLSSLGLMVVAPFTGFEIFTNAGTALYFAAFPPTVLETHLVSESDALRDEFKEISLQNIRLLRKWGDVWTLASNWEDWITDMRGIFGTQSPESRSLRNGLLDYGSPIIQDENEKSATKKRAERLRTLQEPSIGDFELPITMESFESFDIGSLLPGWYDVMHVDP
ncbi:hypothetical protein OGAPHI_005810 [Ogataea philodendri]|uniref:Zn(2)-C6 fungal-type domain-containing protein n=1 Tax=Ogataea philodendri TaxID=1378263 RepID=A0A9P8NYH3_9ASCO|nr:uncharacterized protein OGAPHI_005810 [Ogataea philodendri]KAH3662558.1 hypothetical protein OGAPHI_005810 [Ogataea philodendri]